MTRVTFRQSDLTRAIKAAKAAGMNVTRCEIAPDGRIVLSDVVAKTAADEAKDGYDEWKARREARKSAVERS